MLNICKLYWVIAVLTEQTYLASSSNIPVCNKTTKNISLIDLSVPLLCNLKENVLEEVITLYEFSIRNYKFVEIGKGDS
jgi:hypothetical protein